MDDVGRRRRRRAQISDRRGHRDTAPIRCGVRRAVGATDVVSVPVSKAVSEVEGSGHGRVVIAHRSVIRTADLADSVYGNLLGFGSERHPGDERQDQAARYDAAVVLQCSPSRTNLSRSRIWRERLPSEGGTRNRKEPGEYPNADSLSAQPDSSASIYAL